MSWFSSLVVLMVVLMVVVPMVGGVGVSAMIGRMISDRMRMVFQFIAYPLLFIVGSSHLLDCDWVNAVDEVVSLWNVCYSVGYH